MNNVVNVHVIQAALAEHTGLVGFTVDQGSSQNCLTNASEALLRVPTLSLDMLIDTYDLAPPELVKMDVEGAEAAVPRGAHKVLEHYRPVLFIALHSPEQKRLCQALLESYKYAIYSLEDQPIVGTLKTDEIYALPHKASR
jgi:hypothetical protein